MTHKEAVKTERRLSQVETYGILTQNGLSKVQAFKTAAPNAKPTPNAVSSYNSKARKQIIATPKVLNLAKKKLIEVLEMKPQPAFDPKLGAIEQYPSVTNLLTATQMVLDRADPIVKKHEMNGNLNITGLVDVTHYLEPGRGQKSKVIASGWVEGELADEGDEGEAYPQDVEEHAGATAGA